MTTTQRVLARVFCPFPRQVHPAVSELLEQTCTWAQQMGLIQEKQELRLAGYPRLAAYLHPCTSFEKLTLVARFLVCAFAVDDTFDGLVARPSLRETFVDECLSIIGERIGDLPDPHAVNSPLAHALHDFWRSTFPYTTLAWRQRFFKNMQEYLESNVWEVTNRLSHTIPALATYLEQRKITGCLIPICDLFDVAEQIVLPNALYYSQDVQDLLRAVALHTSLVNDVLSWARECRMGDVHNAVIILQHYEQYSLQEAVDRVSEMIVEQVAAFEETAARIPGVYPEHTAVLARLVAYLRCWMRGNLDWEMETFRFTVAQVGEAREELDNPIEVVVTEER